IRLATGSATVATVTAAGIVAPLASGLSMGQLSLVVLAIGAGSLFFSHVNDAGFWLVKESSRVRMRPITEMIVSMIDHDLMVCP
ncbi:hypothetical protein ACC691_40120, partial [Rhizobium johnstonii]|uniref:GntT/GntP/DsdX family permease n=1 Tax=Rhizobium johnstonii TaxID=3019933 RepID=UPI003F998E93